MAVSCRSRSCSAPRRRGWSWSAPRPDAPIWLQWRVVATIAFLSLFFGLIAGPCPVELAVGGPVAAVELRVDGRIAQTLQGPPWKTEIDFGADLQPHEIVALALDAEGNEIA